MRARRTDRGLAATMACIAIFAFGSAAAADSNLAQGYPEVAGSNLADGYPEPACGERPALPERPEKFETEEAIIAYNAKVDAYNASMERLVECVNAYVANAVADIERIRERARDAIDGLGGQ